MDVTAVAGAATAQTGETASAAPAAGAGVPAASVPGAAVQNAAANTQPAAPHDDRRPLSPLVAKLLAHDGVPNPVNVNVSYRVEHDPNMIVTVFTDPATGAEIAQVPAEVMVQIAQFFDKESGVTLDRSA
jgi:uncharacterized FlaG/YvyC family protein